MKLPWARTLLTNWQHWQLTYYLPQHHAAPALNTPHTAGLSEISETDFDS